MNDWSTLEGQPADRPVHVYPLKDKREHVLDGLFCPCMPKLVPRDPIVVDGVEAQPDHSASVIRHNSYDGRELSEVCIRALDELGKALADHNHTWLPSLRDSYEHAIDLLKMHELTRGTDNG